MANRSSWKLAKPEDIHRIEPDELLAQSDLRRGDVALLTGGPPCQPFSKSANWSNGGIRGLRDPRASTLHAYLKVVEAALSRVLILENVKGLASNHKDEGGWQLFRDEIRTIKRRQGTVYDPQVIHLDAADYGVPQIRERVFILASIDGRKFKVPPPTHGEGDSLEPCRTAWDAIGDLDKEDWPLELEVIGKWAGLLKSIPEGKNYLWHTPRGGGEPLFGWRTRYWSFLIVILIAGVTTNLVEQNRNRLETHLRAAAPEWAWLMLTNPRLRDQHQIEGLAQEWRSEYYDDHDRRTLFISVMKNHSHLRNLAALLSRVDLSDVPAIIFDDEADFGNSDDCFTWTDGSPPRGGTYCRAPTSGRDFPKAGLPHALHTSHLWTAARTRRSLAALRAWTSRCIGTIHSITTPSPICGMCSSRYSFRSPTSMRRTHLACVS
jgi:site-specific DNA-cytosine methylase